MGTSRCIYVNHFNRIRFLAEVSTKLVAHHTFLENRHPEVTKNPYYDLFPEGSQKKYKFMDYNQAH